MYLIWIKRVFFLHTTPKCESKSCTGEIFNTQKSWLPLSAFSVRRFSDRVSDPQDYFLTGGPCYKFRIFSDTISWLPITLNIILVAVVFLLLERCSNSRHKDFMFIRSVLPLLLESLYILSWLVLLGYPKLFVNFPMNWIYSQHQKKYQKCSKKENTEIVKGQVKLWSSTILNNYPTYIKSTETHSQFKTGFCL